jgi:hypothetical protein
MTRGYIGGRYSLAYMLEEEGGLDAWHPALVGSEW